MRYTIHRITEDRGDFVSMESRGTFVCAHGEVPTIKIVEKMATKATFKIVEIMATKASEVPTIKMVEKMATKATFKIVEK